MGVAQRERMLSRVFLTATAEIAVDLQVAAADAVQDEAVIKLLHAQGSDMGQLGLLRFPRIPQKATGRLDGAVHAGAAEAFQGARAELFAQCAGGRIQVEFPARPLPQAAMPRQVRRQREGVGRQDLGWADALHFTGQCCRIGHFQDEETPARDIQRGDAKVPAVTVKREQQVIAGFLEQGIVAERTRRDQAHHLAFHRALAGGRIADLFADGDGHAGIHQFGQVAVGGMEGDAAHGNRCTGRLAAGGEGDVEELRGFFRVLVEQLVEIPHAIEQQFVRMLSLDLQVLLHHGRVLGGGLAQEAGSNTAGMIIFMKRKILRDSAGGLQLFTE